MGLFQKEHSNSSFYRELLKKQKDEKWLEEALRSEFIDINHKDEEGNTFLINCLKAGKFQSVEWLIKHGADIKIKNKEQKAAIHIAIEKNSLPVVKGLLELQTIDVNDRDINGRTLLQDIIVFGNHQMAKLFIRYGTNINNRDIHGHNILHDALSFGDIHFIEYLLNIKELERNILDEEGNSLLQHQQVLKEPNLAKTLINHGVDPTVIPKNGIPYLLEIILDPKEDTIEIVDIAMDNGADPNIELKEGKTIFFTLLLNISLAHKTDRQKRAVLFKVAKKMLLFNAQINQTYNGETILFHAARNQDNELISFLLSAGIDPNFQDKKNETALFPYIESVFNLKETSSETFEETLQLFTSFNINPNHQNIQGWSILHKIILERCDDTLFSLLTQNLLFDYTLQDNLGRTAIHNAIWSDHQVIIQKLHSLETSVINIPDGYNILPITYAALLGNQKLVLLFLEIGSDIKTQKQVLPSAIKKFSPLLKNLPKLLHDLEDESSKALINHLIEEITKDFQIKGS